MRDWMAHVESIIRAKAVAVGWTDRGKRGGECVWMCVVKT